MQKISRKIGEGKQKKVLSLVLCVAMMLSVMVVGAGAAFSDQSKIKNTEAVDACTALNIIGGYPDGSFKPEGNITRAEVTKMICVALNGGKNPAVSTNTTPTFSDVRNNANAAWAEGYIESCAAQGIVSGVGGGKFATNGNVTGVQMAKMLLVSLGYKSDLEGFTGNAWATNVNVRAAQKGLYKGLESMDTNAALTRDNAAQMIWNALKAYEVEYVTNLVADKDGKLSTQITVQDKMDVLHNKITLLLDKYDADITKNAGILTAVKEDNKGTYTITINQNESFTKVEKDYSDLLGQKVDLLLNKDDEVFGVYANEDSSVVATGYVGALEQDGSKTDKIKLDGTSYKLDGSIYDAVGSKANKIVLTANTTSTQTLKALVDTLGAKGNMNKNVAASSIKLIDNNGNGKIDAAVYTPVKVGKVTSVSKSSVTINNGINTVKFEDADVYSGIAKDDYVMFVDEANRSAKDKDSITKLDVTSAKVDGTRTGEAKVNNNWLKLASNLSDAPTTGNTYDLVVVGGVILFSEETSASSKDILYVSGTKNFDQFTGETNGTKDAKVYFTDGTSKTVTVSKLNGNKLNGTTADQIKNGVLYTYSVLSDGTYDVKVLSNDNKAGYDSVTTVPSTETTDNKNQKGYADQKIAGYAPNDDAVIFVQTGKETKVLSGKQIKNWGDGAFTTTSYTYALSEKNGINYVTVAALINEAQNNVPGATKDTLYGYLTADGYTADRNGEDKATYEVWTNEGAKTLYADTTSVVTGAVAGAVISYNVNGDYIENIAVNAGAGSGGTATPGISKAFSEVAITGFDYKAKGELSFVAGANVGRYTENSQSKYLIKKGLNQITLDDDCIFIGMNDADNAGVEGATLEQIQLANAGDHSSSASETVLTNAYVVVGGDDNKVIAVIFDADQNELDSSHELVKSTGAQYVAP